MSTRSVAIRTALVTAVVLAFWGSYSLACRSRIAKFQQDCQRAAKQENWSDLNASSRAWTNLDPASPEAWVARAEARRRLYDFPGTAEALGKIPKSFPRFSELALLRADLLLSEIRDVPAAERTWREVLEVDPLSPQAWQRLIYVYAMTLRRPEMMTAIRRAAFLQREPAEAYVYAMTWSDMSFSDGALRLLEWTQVTPGIEPLEVALATYMATAPYRTSSGLFPDPELVPGSMAGVDRCRLHYPHNANLLAFLIDRAMVEGDIDGVERLLQDARDVEADARFPRYRGWVLELRRQPAEADREYQRAIALYPLDWKTRQQRGGVLRILGQAAAAKRESELALRGKRIGRSLAALPTAADADENLMREVLAYMDDCGEHELASALRRRL